MPAIRIFRDIAHYNSENPPDDSYLQIEFNNSSDKRLLQHIRDTEININSPCGGNGTCGKCKVQILSDFVNEYPVKEEEKRTLTQDELDQGIRLACLHIPSNHIDIFVEGEEKNHAFVTHGYTRDFEFSPSITKRAGQLEAPSLENQLPYENRIKAALSISHTEKLAFEVLSMPEQNSGTITAVFYDDALIYAEHGDTSSHCYGIAVDIGTTTVVGTLINLNNGEEMGSVSLINPQSKFGHDVLTRITYAMNDEGTPIKVLQRAIVGALNQMVIDLVNMNAGLGVTSKNIYEISIAANTTMLHFLLGIDTRTIGKSPYTPVFISAQNIRASKIGIHAAPSCRLYTLPSVSSYIGADIVAGAYTTDLKSATGNTLFIDIGTNGEMILSSKGKMISCSCAAGPAFEGMNVTCGMKAAEGSIEEIEIDEDGVKIKTIGDMLPIGICGSGILAIIRELIKRGIVKASGAFIKPTELKDGDYRLKMISTDEDGKRYFYIPEYPEIKVTQGDIRQIQLAKGAILSGFWGLLNHENLKLGDLDEIIIAGQFGAKLSVDSLIGVGIVPEDAKDIINYVGNTSKAGAYMALMSAKAKRELEALSVDIDYFELSMVSDYEQLFSKSLKFPKIN